MSDSARVGVARVGFARVGSLGVISDWGAGSDSIATEVIGTFITITDLGAGQDIVSSRMVANEVLVADAAHGTSDVARVTAHILASDHGSGADSAGQSADFYITDYGGLADHTARVGLARVGLARAGHLGGGETIIIRASSTVSDHGQGFEVVSWFNVVVVTDTGLGDDRLAIEALLTILDQGTGFETLIDITELIRPPFRVILVTPKAVSRLTDPATIPKIKSPKTKAVLWP